MSAVHLTPRWIAPIPLILGSACLGLLAAANLPPYVPAMSSEAAMTLPGSLTLHAQTGLLLAGAGLTAWGISGARLARPRLLMPPLELAAVVAILVLALLLRLHDRERVLPVLIDEYNFVAAATRASVDPTLRLLVPTSDWAPYTWLYTTIQVSMADLFGHTLSAVRGASLVLGMAQIAATYALARALCGRWIGLLAALALACLAPHLHYSNTAYSPHPGDTLFGLLTVLFVTRGLRDRRPIDWALAGASLGLTQYWYEAGRLFFPVLIATWLIVRLLLRTESVRALLPGVARLIVMAVAVGAPVYLTLTALDRTYTYRFDSENVLNEFWAQRLQDGFDASDAAAVLGRVARPFLFYSALPETPGIPYYQGAEPLIVRAFAPFFVIGLVVLVRHPRAPGVVLLLWIGGVALANGLFIRDPMVSTRYGLVVPALAIVLAVGVDATAHAMMRAGRALARRLAGPIDRREVGRFALGLVAVGAFGVINVDHYFNQAVPDLLATLRNFVVQRDLFDVGLRASRYPFGAQVYIIDGTMPDMMDVDALLAWQTYNQHITPRAMSPLDLLREPFTADRDYLFFVRASDAEALMTVYTRFPDASPIQHTTSEIPPHDSYVLIPIARSAQRAPAPADRFSEETASPDSTP